MSRAAVMLFILALASFAHCKVADMGNPQGALWRLMEEGHKQQAEALENELKHILSTESLDALTIQGGGISVSYIAKMSRNIFAIVKEADPELPESYKNEVAAHVLDKLLGLHMVPLTVYRQDKGKMYSVQIFYSSFPSGEVLDLMESEFFTRRGDAAIFDFIINNDDRSLWDGSNALLGKDGRLVLFDQARTFSSGRAVTMQASLHDVSPALRERILKLNKIEVEKEMRGLLSESAIEALLQRLSLVQNGLEKIKTFAAPTQRRTGESDLKVPVKFEIPERAHGLKFSNLLSVKASCAKLLRP